MTNLIPEDHERSLNEGIKSAEINTTSSEISRSLASDLIVEDFSTNKTSSELIESSDKNSNKFTEDETIKTQDKVSSETAEDVPIEKLTDKKTTKDSEKTGRRKSRAILEHLMTRARFYKMLESKMNR